MRSPWGMATADSIHYDSLPEDLQVLILQLVEDVNLDPGVLPGFAFTSTVLELQRVPDPVYREVGSSGGDERDAMVQSLVDATIAPIGREYIDLGKQPIERQIFGNPRVRRNCMRDRRNRPAAGGYDDKHIRFVLKR